MWKKSSTKKNGEWNAIDTWLLNERELFAPFGGENGCSGKSKCNTTTTGVGRAQTISLETERHKEEKFMCINLNKRRDNGLYVTLLQTLERKQT
uniref:Uncharacterized protein n=1 Tax=Romanomermis culicivorax TaxID=13658 RepID=A0A915K3Y9_ROMCU